MRSRGHLKEALSLADTLLGKLSQIKDRNESMEYMLQKVTYQKLKLLVKMQLLQQADDLVKKMIAEVKPHIETNPEEDSAKVVEIVDQDDPKPYWKFAIKASYIQVSILATETEYAEPKRILEEFSLPAVQAFLKHFYPDLPKEEGVLASKVLPDHYYSFQYRKAQAKLRRLAYFVDESEKTYLSILHDELRYYPGLYSFNEFDSENPIV
jgi:hypothetical protein